jgi:L-ascorbate metabolism protein UlaG (beta-lactamase superfamily)
VTPHGRRIVAALAAAASGGAVVTIGSCHALSAAGYEGPVTDHFDGQRFRNLEPVAGQSAWRAARWLVRGTRAPWPDWVRARPGPPPPRCVAGGAMRVTWVNHATVLVQFDGLNVLTDPIWSERASPVGWAGPPRHRPPGVRFEDLPRIDVVLVSHNHYDHMDLPTLRRLAREHRPRVFVGLGNARYLADRGVAGAVDLDWWQGVTVVGPAGPVRVASVPVRHQSARTPTDGRRTLWTGFALRGPSGAVYVGGDTGYGAHFRAAAAREGPFRLALLPIGAFLPRDLLADHHMSPRDALAAARDLEAGTTVPMHFGTFAMGGDGPRDALDSLRTALDGAGRAAPRVWVLEHGAGRDAPAVSSSAASRDSALAERLRGPGRAACDAASAVTADSAPRD